MRITLLITVLVMTSVSGTPSKDRSLRGHRAENAEAHRDDGTGTERLVREESVIADGDSEAGDDVHHGHQRELNPADAAAPEVDDSRDQPDHGRENGDQIRDSTAERKTDVAVDIVAYLLGHGRLGRGGLGGRGGQGAQMMFHSVVRCLG